MFTMKKNRHSRKRSTPDRLTRRIGLLWRIGTAAMTLGLLFGATKGASGQVERQAITGGGILTGTLLNPETAEGEDYVVLLSEGSEITLTPNMIRKKEVLRPETIYYRMTAPLEEDSIESHAEIAAWCDEKSLPIEARLHRERIVELDPNNEAARKALGYEKKDGVWMTPKERREQAGLTMYAGRSVTPQEAQLLRQRDEFRKAAAQWKKRLKAIQTRLRNQDQAPAAKEELRSITAPEALSSITGALRQDAEFPQNRVLYVQAMGNIGTPAAMGDLASVALVDNDGEVRLTALEKIKEHPKAIPGAVEYFRQALRRPENFMVNRAGFALGFFDARDAADDLVNALITTHRETIVIPGSQTTATFSNKGMAFNPGSGDQTKTITQTLENADVLGALRSIVQSHYPIPADFGFDVAAWKNWFIEQRNLKDFSSRRDF